jgi:hypothetical protein
LQRITEAPDSEEMKKIGGVPRVGPYFVAVLVLGQTQQSPPRLCGFARNAILKECEQALDAGKPQSSSLERPKWVLWNGAQDTITHKLGMFSK